MTRSQIAEAPRLASHASGSLRDSQSRAYAWWGIAAQQGYEAMTNKGIVEQRMTTEQIAKAQELSSKLWEKYVVPFQKD